MMMFTIICCNAITPASSVEKIACAETPVKSGLSADAINGLKIFYVL